MVFRFSEYRRLNQIYCWTADFSDLSGFYWGLIVKDWIFEIWFCDGSSESISETQTTPKDTTISHHQIRSNS